MSLLRYLISVNKVLDLRYNDEIKEAITNKIPNVTFDASDIVMIPKDKVTLSGEDLEYFNKLLAMLDDIEDVRQVYHNVNL